ncbi:MAG: pyruvate kinase [Candidatus Fischerbacteria bacterium RBG_13_37_8]|uniref:Pyruvate kinase n=1 Tax=Candidatus Fischerbacteria bacterium RBG_13_37_8 TaxID=1817863 RepID=A0A1F5VKQ1_9BACT|nr:MAG: pyruvate kinase [Candidatus Fischerbacteria bacterium RBG_13_37_8]
MKLRKTKIICTIGPASESPEMLRELAVAGMDIARLNFSHGSHEQFKKIIAHIRTLNRELKKNITILQDLQGFKLRLGTLNDKYLAQKNAILTLNDSIEQQVKNDIPVMFPHLHKLLKPAQKVYLVDGQIELLVLEIKGNRIITCVIKEGYISSRKGINIPFTTVTTPLMNEKDKQDAAFGVKENVDFIGLSFVRGRGDIQELRKYLKKFNAEKKIIAKIERREAVENIKEIIQEADGIMVARGDLGIEIGPERVPIVQKNIINLCNKEGKPVITATQMLTSMIEKPVPTRAEVSDISNSILDKTDAVLLSDETSIGKYPVEAVNVIHKTALLVEKRVSPDISLSRPCKKSTISPISVGDDVIRIAYDVSAKCIVAFTRTGFTAMHIAKHRPTLPVITFTNNETTRNELSLFWGMRHIFIISSFENKLTQALPVLKQHKLIKQGDTLVLVSAGKITPHGKIDELVICRCQ